MIHPRIPQQFVILLSARKQGMPVLGELHHWKDSKDNLFQLPHFLVEETKIKRLYNSVLRSHTSYQWIFHDNTHGLLFFFFFFFFHCLALNPMFSSSWIYSFNKHLALTCTYGLSTYGLSIVIGTEQKMPPEKQRSKWKNTVPALQTLSLLAMKH